MKLYAKLLFIAYVCDSEVWEASAFLVRCPTLASNDRLFSVESSTFLAYTGGRYGDKETGRNTVLSKEEATEQNRVTYPRTFPENRVVTKALEDRLDALKVAKSEALNSKRELQERLDSLEKVKNQSKESREALKKRLEKQKTKSDPYSAYYQQRQRTSQPAQPQRQVSGENTVQLERLSGNWLEQQQRQRTPSNNRYASADRNWWERDNDMQQKPRSSFWDHNRPIGWSPVEQNESETNIEETSPESPNPEDIVGSNTIQVEESEKQSQATRRSPQVQQTGRYPELQPNPVWNPTRGQVQPRRRPEPNQVGRRSPQVQPRGYDSNRRNRNVMTSNDMSTFGGSSLNVFGDVVPKEKKQPQRRWWEQGRNAKPTVERRRTFTKTKPSPNPKPRLSERSPVAKYDYDPTPSSIRGISAVHAKFRDPNEKTVDGNSLQTWSFQSPFVESVQVLMKTEGRPLNADIDMWQGPDNSPQRLRVYIEDGKKTPFSAVMETPRGPHTVGIRNTAQMELPFSATVVPDSPDRRIAPTSPRNIQGSAQRSYPFGPDVESVQVLMQTDGNPLNAKIEILQGANNVKQVIELYTENGSDRPFYTVIQTPDRAGTVIRVINTSPITFPLTASVDAYEVLDAYGSCQTVKGHRANNRW